MDKHRFSMREVTRSFRKFRDLVNDLRVAPYQIWGDRLSHLVDHCENDPVMRVVTESLRAPTRTVNAQTWYDESLKTHGGMLGSGRYELPEG